MGQFSIGQSVRRREDPRLLTGRGRFYDDLKLADQLHAAIVRSPHAHADIRGIDTRAALQMPGVHVGADRQGLRGRRARHHVVDGALQEARRQRDVPAAPAGDRGRPRDACRLSGRGRGRRHARSGARRRRAGRGRLRAAPGGGESARDAFEPGAPQLYDDCPNNEAYFYQAGNKAAVDEAFARAAHVVEQRLVINRVTANTLEPRGVTGEYDAGTGRYTLQCGFQRPWLFRNAIAESTFKIPESQLRLITGDIGGSYGLRGSIYPEIILMLWAARRAGKPVKWLATRNEAHISDDDARDNIVDAALALDKDGKFLARADPELRQSRRLRVVPRRDAAGGQHRHGVRRLHHAGAARGGLRHAHQHALHLALSRRRAARGVLHDRAADRHRRRRDEDRSRRSCAAATPFRRERCPTRRRSPSPTTAGASRRTWTAP